MEQSKDIKMNLLEKLQHTLGIAYLSDLSRTGNLWGLVAAVEELDSESYGRKEWEDAYAYLLGTDVAVPLSESVKSRLLYELTKRARNL